MAIENKNRTAEEDASINVAEESRETQWKSKSYMGSIFVGDFDISIPHRGGRGFPEQDPVDKAAGDRIHDLQLVLQMVPVGRQGQVLQDS